VKFIVSAVFAAALAVVAPGLSAAQEQGQDQVPAEGQDITPQGQAQQFGPRAGKQGQPQLPPTETIGKFGDWEVQCTELPKAANADKATRNCGMIQTAKYEKNQNIGISVIVSKLKREDKPTILMRVMVPIGVYLPTGIPVEIDGNALPNRLVFTRCLPRVCEGFGEASPESLNKFLKGNMATFYLYDRPGNGYPLKISLSGFAKALGELDKL
jgi:invasion protein IalB